jgi:hypothetical protein
MALLGVIANGTKVAYSASSPVSWTRIGQLRNIPTFISLVADDLDTTVHSTSSIMTSAPGMIPPPEVQMELLADLDPVTSPAHETMRQYSVGGQHANSGATIWLRIEVPSNRAQSAFRAWEFQCYVKDFTIPSLNPPELTLFNVTVKFSGNLAVYNPGASQIT